MATAVFKECPRDTCKRRVSKVLFCCPDCWWDIPKHLREGLSRTAWMAGAPLPHTVRAEVERDTVLAWRHIDRTRARAAATGAPT